MATLLPAGIGTATEVDLANRWMGEQPWYRSLLASWGQTPQNTRLSDTQRRTLIGVARQQGLGVSGDFEMDPSGNIQRSGHKLRNALIIGGAAAAALTGGAALGLFGAGGAGGAAGGAAAGAGAGLTGSTVPVIGGLAGGAGAAGAAGTAAAGVSGAGLAAGVASSPSWLRAAVPSLIGAGTSLAGGVFQTRASNDAARLQADAAQKALDWEKERDANDRALAAEALAYNRRIGEDALGRQHAKYGDFSGRLSGYFAAGATANDRAAAFLGQPAPSERASTMTAPASAPVVATSAPATVTAAGVPKASAMPMPRATEATVMMQAPDGTTKAVPVSERDYWIGKGAQQVA